ncbi:MAG: hypothetical protein NWQ13_06725 [Glaciimonas sp.]|nr:hypothetical protein [Glaciimonas sp.]
MKIEVPEKFPVPHKFTLCEHFFDRDVPPPDVANTRCSYPDHGVEGNLYQRRLKCYIDEGMEQFSWLPNS